MNFPQEISAVANQYLKAVQSLSFLDINREDEVPASLIISQDLVRAKTLTTFYAPFDYVNSNARLVIVGLTPGKSQARVALRELKRCLDGGLSHAESLKRAKNTASFSGAMRRNLVASLDHMKVGKLLNAQSVEGVWDQADHVHFTSCLRYPVLVDGENYSGKPKALKVPCLRTQVDAYLGAEMRALPEAVFVPLGDEAAEMVELTAKANGIPDEQVLSGFPHPSPSNIERTQYFLGIKSREQVSNRVVPEKIDRAKENLARKIDFLIRNFSNRDN